MFIKFRGEINSNCKFLLIDIAYNYLAYLKLMITQYTHWTATGNSCIRDEKLSSKAMHTNNLISPQSYQQMKPMKNFKFKFQITSNISHNHTVQTLYKLLKKC